MTADHTIEPGQVYESCDPRGGPRIRVVAYTPGAARADVVDADDGRRRREILVRALHVSGVRGDGRRRHTGYRLVQEG